MARVKKEPPKYEFVDESSPESVADVIDHVDEDLAAFVPVTQTVATTGDTTQFCILDDAPVNSVLVILKWPNEPAEPVLQTPSGKIDVPQGDLSWKLPLMAEIKRVATHSFVAIQRDDPVGKPKLVCATAVEACQKFKKHFHDERD